MISGTLVSELKNTNTLVVVNINTMKMTFYFNSFIFQTAYDIQINIETLRNCRLTASLCLHVKIKLK